MAARLLNAMARDALAACDPAEAARRAVAARPERITLCGRTISLRGRGRILLLAYGKAAPAMSRGLLQRLREAGGKRPVRALVIAPGEPEGSGSTARRGRDAPARRGLLDDLPRGQFRVESMKADHPVPLRASFAAGRRALQWAGRAGAADDVIYLASGGGSALMAAPLARFVKPAEKSSLHRVLLTCGAPIGAMNTVRKHLSAIKGGRLAMAARNAATQTTLVLCDVDPERYTEVASGPSLPDGTTIDDMIRAIDFYGIATAIPPSVLEAMRAGRLPETPKPREPALRASRSALILSNRDLRHGAVRAGLARGLPAEAVPTEQVGPVESAVEMVARAIETAPPGTRLLVLGGEVLTVPSGSGQGGRAQEFALRLALRMAGLGSRPWAFLAIGSDGRDGTSPAAGAFADSTTLERARLAGVDAARLLRESQTHRFFTRLEDLVVTGPTGTNLRDLYLLLTGPVVLSRRRVAPLRQPAPDRGPSPPGSES
jgi:glycerate-2-kinase